MDKLFEFYATYGWQMTIIALAGIIVLGLLKYLGAFKKLSERNRHYCYLAISVGLSAIGTAIYLACVKLFTLDLFITIALANYALNQTFYNLFKILSVNELFVLILDTIKKLFIKEAKK